MYRFYRVSFCLPAQNMLMTFALCILRKLHVLAQMSILHILQIVCGLCRYRQVLIISTIDAPSLMIRRVACQRLVA